MASRYAPFIDFSPFSKLYGAYEEGLDKSREETVRQAFAGGLPRGPDGQIDYGAMATIMAKHGKIDSALEVSKLAEAQRQQDAFTKNFGAIMSGNAPPAAPPQTMPAAPPAMPRGPVAPGVMPSYSGEPPRAKVPSSARTVGDDEAIAAGIYEDPTKLAQGLQAPMQNPTPAGAIPVQTQTFRPPPPPAPLAPPAVPGTAPVKDQARVPGQVPPVPIVPQNPVSGRIQQLMALLASPGGSPSQKKGMEMALQKELDNAKLPDEIKKYTLYHGQELAAGKVPKSFEEYELGLKRAQATLINTAEGMEAKVAGARIGVDTETAKELAKMATAGSRILPLLDQVINLADKTPGGWAGPVAASMAKAFSAAGFEVPEGWSNAELLQSVSQRLVPIVREPGATSEKEMQIYLASVPGLMQSQEGRLKIAKMTRDIVVRSQQIAKVYRENLGSPDLYEKLAALDKPVFKPPVSGAELAPDGNWYVRKDGKIFKVTQ